MPPACNPCAHRGAGSAITRAGSCCCPAIAATARVGRRWPAAGRLLLGAWGGVRLHNRPHSECVTSLPLALWRAAVRRRDLSASRGSCGPQVGGEGACQTSATAAACRRPPAACTVRTYARLPCAVWYRGQLCCPPHLPGAPTSTNLKTIRSPRLLCPTMPRWGNLAMSSSSATPCEHYPHDWHYFPATLLVKQVAAGFPAGLPKQSCCDARQKVRSSKCTMFRFPYGCIQPGCCAFAGCVHQPLDCDLWCRPPAAECARSETGYTALVSNARPAAVQCSRLW